MDAREARGRVLAQAQGERIRQIEGDVWYVPSSSQDAGGYLVSNGRCSCPDENPRCKHMIAVEIVRGAIVKVDATPVAVVPKPTKLPPLRGDLSAEEQNHVRAALRFLRTFHRGQDALEKALRLGSGSLHKPLSGRRVSASIAVRVARLAGTSVDSILAGEWPPPGMCPHCGQVAPA